MAKVRRKSFQGAAPVPTDRLRSLYNDLVKSYPNKVISEGYLRSESSLNASATMQTISMPITVQQGSAVAPNNTEVRLPIVDTFVASSFGFFLMKSGSTVTATQAQIAVSRLYTYPNISIFVGASESVNLQAIYNGYLQIIINNKTFYDRYPMMKFYRVPQLQQGLLVFTASTTDRDEWETNNGMYPITPTLRISGVWEPTVTINVPSSLALLGTNSQNFAVLVFYGYKIQNASSVMK